MKHKKILVKRTDMPDLDRYIKHVRRLWKSKWLTNNGEYAKKLADELKEYLSIPNIALLTNGTLSLHIALKLLDLPEGGEIITTPFTFVATTNVIIWERFRPVFVDIDPVTWNIDPTAIVKAITPNTVAIMPVHVYGNPCNVETIDDIAKKHDLKVVYDAAHAFGVKYRGRSILSYGDISSLSFHATKIFHTIEGGALVTSSKRLHELVECARNFGIVEHEEIVILPGTNAKMNEFQAAMGLCNLPQLQHQLQVRESLYNSYKVLLSGSVKIRFQKIIASTYNYAYMPVCFESLTVRDKVLSSLQRHNIFPRKYFYPLTSSFDFSSQYKKHSLINGQRIADGILCLPLHGELTNNDVREICQIILKEI